VSVIRAGAAGPQTFRRPMARGRPKALLFPGDARRYNESCMALAVQMVIVDRRLCTLHHMCSPPPR